MTEVSNSTVLAELKHDPDHYKDQADRATDAVNMLNDAYGVLLLGRTYNQKMFEYYVSNAEARKRAERKGEDDRLSFGEAEELSAAIRPDMEALSYHTNEADVYMSAMSSSIIGRGTTIMELMQNQLKAATLRRQAARIDLEENLAIASQYPETIGELALRQFKAPR